MSVNHRELKGADIFKIVWTGWFWGVTALFFPVLALGAVTMLFVNPSEAIEAVVGLFVVPIVAAGQGVLAGFLVGFGLRIHRWVTRRSSQQTL